MTETAGASNQPEKPIGVAPVASKARIPHLDALRGAAILGILMVNVQWFAGPVMWASMPLSMFDQDPAEWLAYGFVQSFFAMRFITLFSLLFGIGLALQSGRSADEGAFKRTYLRRLFFLAVMGALHGVFLFLGDILLTYAFAGFVLFLCRKWSARGLAIAGGITLGIATLVGGVFASFGGEHDTVQLDDIAQWHDAERRGEWVYDGGGEEMEPATLSLPLSMDSFDGLAESLEEWDSDLYVALELSAFRQGPFGMTVLMRLIGYAIMLAVVAFHIGWRSLGLFFLGAALLKWGFFDPDRKSVRRQVFQWGLGLGIPVGLVTGTLVCWAMHEQTALGLISLNDLASLLLASGYAGAICVWVDSGRCSRLLDGLQAVGRMALTNYIGQSVVMTLVFCWFGLGLYGELGRPELIALTLLCFAVQLVLSVLWLRAFKMGPLEWLWRCASYGRLLPLRR